ncbi:hypothetical protein [Veronia pacifica]|nr:hypothetical protein [Veronia pacifica]
MTKSASWQRAVTSGEWENLLILLESDTATLSTEEKIGQYSQAANAAKKANQYQFAIGCYQIMLELVTTDSERASIYGWLSSCSADDRNFEAAEKYGKSALNLQDHLAEVGKINTRNVVSFSLFGSNPKYCETAILNAEAMSDIYPDWIMQVFYDETVPTHVLERLKQLDVELTNVADVNAEHMPGTFWRFLALENIQNDIVLCRDIDSIVCERERVLVDEWLASRKAFHVIRDWFGHTDLILAGLWGTRFGLLTGIREMIEHYLKHAGDNVKSTHADQFFLAEYIWPRIRHSCCHHSSIFSGVLEACWPDSEARMLENKDGNDQLGSWKTTSISISNIGDAFIDIVENGKVICSYQLEKGGVLSLPRLYRTRIQKNVYQLIVRPADNS